MIDKSDFLSKLLLLIFCWLWSFGWSQQETIFSLYRVLKLIASQPTTFSLSDFTGIRKVVIKKFNTLYYRQKEDRIEIISFFSNRQNPDKLEKLL